MKLSRRDLLVWGTGAAAGLVVTPVPWKLLDDVSIWSQNWKWIPQPPRGPIEVKQSCCTLCPNGCAMRVRMAGGWPVGVAGISTHPISRGALCPLGFGAHQLNWHPQRLRAVRHKSHGSSWTEAQAAFTKACNEGPVIAIDGYPGRAASSVLETFAQERGEYRVALGPETRSLLPYQKWSNAPATALGYDLEHAQTILSFGTPLLSGWGTPGRFTRLWAERATGTLEPQLRLIQVDAELSPTASRAWKWVPVHRGSEAALAAGLARVLLEEHLVASLAPIPSMTLSDAAVQTGLSPDAIRDLARTMMDYRPVVAVAKGDRPEIAALNVVLGAIGTSGGILRRSEAVQLPVLAEAPIRSARAILVDASVPWDFDPKTDAEIFRFAAWDGGSSNAEWLLPAPGFLEETTDVPTAPGSAIETYTIAPSLTRPTHEVHGAAEFLRNLDGRLLATEKIIHERCESLLRKRAGTLHSQELTPIAKIATPQKLEEELHNGAVWVSEPSQVSRFHCELKEWPTISYSSDPPLSPDGWEAAVLPPLASKLYNESDLRETESRRNA